MTELRKASARQRVIELLPTAISREITRVVSSRRGGISGIREIRIRCEGLSTVKTEWEDIGLLQRVGREECRLLVSRLIGGALYAHRDSIASGYLSLEGGVRVGVCGSAAYDGGRLVGINDIRTLLFRIPTGKCAFSRELFSVYKQGIGNGMLIYSAPGVGKTTALRSLAKSVGELSSCSVAVVDERCEFSAEDYSACRVDILRGYRRREGIEIATRTLSCGLLMVDELGADDGEAILNTLRCGVPLVATAHANSLEELMAKPSLKGLLECSAFSVFVGISAADGVYKLKVDRI